MKDEALQAELEAVVGFGFGEVVRCVASPKAHAQRTTPLMRRFFSAPPAPVLLMLSAPLSLPSEAAEAPPTPASPAALPSSPSVSVALSPLSLPPLVEAWLEHGSRSPPEERRPVLTVVQQLPSPLMSSAAAVARLRRREASPPPC